MKNFEMKYPVEGTSALQPKLDPAPARRARIIAFPERPISGARVAQPRRASESLVSAVRAGTAQGVSFDRVQRWQAVLGGCVFAALAFAGLIVGL